MGKLNRYRVVVDPRRSLFGVCILGGGEKELRACNLIVESIRRHVDNIEHCAVEVDSAECEFCGRPWTEGNSPHNGGCCDEDAEIMAAYPEEDDRA